MSESSRQHDNTNRWRGRRNRQVVAVTLLSVAMVAPTLLMTMPARPQAPSPGELLAFDRGKGNCLTCHEIKGGDAPGNVGPPLAEMKKRYPHRKELAGIIFDETKRNPLTVMPPFGRNLILNEREIDQIIDFLYTR
jgi:L-cysteine S-thiosulfotransferase